MPEASEPMEEDNDPFYYYKRILLAARQLAEPPASHDGDQPMTDEEEPPLPNDESSYLDQIAQALMECTNVLHLSTNGLFPIREQGSTYIYRRVDYLRRLLKACAPIAMEVAARTTGCDTIQSYVLHCFWVPLAPQIFPGVWKAFTHMPECPVTRESQVQADRIVCYLEATYVFAQYIAVERNQERRLVNLWDWNWLFRISRHVHQLGHCHLPSVLYYLHRLLAYTNQMGILYLEEQKVDSLAQEFFQHPWDIRHEEALYEELILFHQSVVIWDSEDAIRFPDDVTSCHQNLICMEGLRFWKHERDSTPILPSLVMTDTTQKNLLSLATALVQHQYPAILMYSHVHLIHYVAARLNIPVLELYLDETTDIPSTLYGSTVPSNGTFAWQWGVIATAMKKGHWVILHGMTMDWQAALELVIRDGILTHSTKPTIRADFSFRLFGVVDQKDRLLAPDSWYVPDPMEEPSGEECLEIGRRLFDNIPQSILEAVVNVSPTPMGLRHFLKLLRRIEHCLPSSGQYITEHQRLLCAAECLDVHGMAEPNVSKRHQWLESSIAPAFGLTAELVIQFTEKRSEPSRISFPSDRTYNGLTMRLLERLAVCVREQEPVLLVGETGTGKTTTIQMLAKIFDRPLIVQNVSLQTDSTDLLGGYKPVELKHVGRKLYEDFIDLFTGTFSRKQNAKFLGFAAQAYEQADWKKLSQCCRKAAEMGLAKVNEKDPSQASIWKHFQHSALMFEQHRTASGPVFEFVEGAMVDAIRNGKWVLLDEINLASSETLQRLCGLLNDDKSSLTITERGDLAAIDRHPSFRIFAAMNPATDVGKKDLAHRIRSRFTELFVDEILNPLELRTIVAESLQCVLDVSTRPAIQSESVVAVVETYLKCRELAYKTLADGSGQKPRYTLRTLTRAVTAARQLVLEQKFSMSRALVEGFLLAFQGPLDSSSFSELKRCVYKNLGRNTDKSQMEQPGRRPGGRRGGTDFALISPFWIQQGELECVDLADQKESPFVLVPSTKMNLRRLARALASGKWPILLEGPTSAGKTSLVQYVAARCGHKVVRINNHEHTDVQEYIGGFTSDTDGCLAFRDGILVSALREGHWVILDELNLAPSDVLEALNRLLDDNRELFISETNEIVKPHSNFRLFATQNPSGSYGGRKPLSRAFRNRFVEIQVNGIPTDELVVILTQRCELPRSHALLLVDVMNSLQEQRSQEGVFLGKEAFITPRDLLRWASRNATTKHELAEQGFMLLAERLRTDEEKVFVQRAIEKHFKAKLDIDSMYYGPNSKARQFLKCRKGDQSDFPNLALTKSLLRVVRLLIESSLRREPVLLVGETGCGKTMAVQLFSKVMEQNICILNCHQTTETSDLIGGLRPTRGRASIKKKILNTLSTIASELDESGLSNKWNSIRNGLPDFIESDNAISTLRAVRREIEEGYLTDSFNRQPPSPKRRRLDCDQPCLDGRPHIHEQFDEVERLLERYHSLFEWEDGPLVSSMRSGFTILLDELSLADDAVLERLNPVLEPSRTITLAERNSNNHGDHLIQAHEEFQLFATMNPGGDYGKRELSPALRSRFTEIWVPPINDFSDISLVLDRTLRSCQSIPSSLDLHPLMLDYVKWFNGAICDHLSLSWQNLALSIRDILTWARFVVQCRQGNDSITAYDAYFHGAKLMHLDGLGLGMGLSINETVDIKEKAEKHLRNQLAAKGVSVDDPIPCFEHKGDFFGCVPFLIESSSCTFESDFQLHAPTTAQNVYRVLRAMQVAKPILLEGPPGVGKTTLVETLAKCVGRKLTRINLSEQTEISDLIGSDLPVATSSCSSPEFMWFDGVLLTAIKRGDWVLLDELNLASQAVLEGLNSCLDHRADIYVPDTGQTFKCPPGFRIFAAQNPLGQGGGRKGLPKSFLNRFSKVFVEPLTTDDYRHIVCSRFSSVSNTENLIAFNGRLCRELDSCTSFAKIGSPWEFNLRDIFRFCRLKSTRRLDDSTIAEYLYMLRLRSEIDREVVRLIFADVFQSDTPGGREVDILSQVQCGPRNMVHSCPVRKSSCSLRHHTCFRAIQECIAMHWPCLLTGSANSSILDTIRSLAIAGGAPLNEMSMTSSSDVSELIGCYDHVDVFADFQKVTECVMSLISPQAIKRNQKLEHPVSILRRRCPSTSDELNLGIEECGKLIDGLLDMSVEPSEVMMLKKLKTSLDQISQSSGNKASSFVWTDGPLVSAMENGEWLHLVNVNLCPPSVLDRLNSVMEPNGYLLLAEAGAKEMSEGESHRKIQCHPNFRLFLSMDPSFGEVSRAMRNRCVELHLDTNATSLASRTAFQLDEVSKSSICSLLSARTILQKIDAITERNSSETFLGQATACVKALGRRGKSPFPRLQQIERKFEIEMIPAHLSVGDDSMLVSTGAFRSLNILACVSSTERRDLFACTATLHLKDHVDLCENVLPSVDQELIRDRIAFTAATKPFFVPCISSTASNSLFRDICELDVLAEMLEDSRVDFARPGMDHIFREIVWKKHQSAARNQSKSQVKTLLETSFEWFSCHLRGDSMEAKISIVPFIYPFFETLDHWLDDRYPMGTYTKRLEIIAQQRNMLWDLAAEMPISSFRMTDSFPQFVFCAQWEELRSSLDIIMCNDQENAKLNGLVERISYSLLRKNHSLPEGKSLLKFMPYPALPRTRTQWDVLLQMKQISKMFTPQESTVVKGISGMLENKEWCLADIDNLKEESLALISTVFASNLIVKQGAKPLDSAIKQVAAALKVKIETIVRSLYTVVNEARSDLVASSSNVLFEAEALKEHSIRQLDFNGKVEALSSQLLDKVAGIQLAVAVEHYMEHLEMDILNALYGFVNNTFPLEAVYNLRPKVSLLIAIGTTKSLWTMTDISLYQVLAWILELQSTNRDELVLALRRILPMLSANATKRSTSTRSARSLLNVMPCDLEVPLLIDDDSSPPDLSQRSNTMSSTPTVLTFSLLQGGFYLSRHVNIKHSFLTIENASARTRQGVQFLKIMSLLSRHERTSEFGHNELEGEFNDISHVAHGALSSQTEAIGEGRNDSDIIEALCSFVGRDMAQKLVLPIVSSLASIKGKLLEENSVELARPLVFLGLLQLHMFAPDSALDPGTRPEAMIAIINKRMHQLFQCLHCEAFDYIWANGVELDHSENSAKVLLEVADLRHQLENEKSNKIERPLVQKSFSDVFGEVQRFIESQGSISTVLGLVSGSDCHEAALQNWFKTVDTFCERMSDFAFAAYEDVVCRIIGAVGKIRRGLRILLHNKTAPQKNMFSLRFSPLTDESTRRAVLSHAGTFADNGVCRRSLALSTLHQLVMESKVLGIGENILHMWERAVEHIYRLGATSLSDEGLVFKNGGNDDDDGIDENYFPDHRSEYVKLADRENVDDGSSTTAESEDEDEDPKVSLEFADIVCDLHTLLFNKQEAKDQLRHQTFMRNFDAACAFECATSGTEILLEPAAACFAFAISILSPPSAHLRTTQDFYNDPNVAESLKAFQPLSELRARAIYLLEFFPGNSVLTAVARIVDKVLKLDLRLSPFGKVMAGVDVLMRHAQDWEQHASSRVQFSKPLEHLHRIAIDWRKMEISCWASALQSREERFMKKAKEKWFYLNTFLRNLRLTTKSQHDNPKISIIGSAPSWVWRSLIDRCRCSEHWHDTELVYSLTKALDTFCLTASIGEFETRLCMLQNFGYHFDSLGLDSVTVAITRSLKSTFAYYSQFLSKIKDHQAQSKQNIEKELQSEVKLAKWDTQTHFAMEQSSQRNRKKVVGIMGRYDTILQENVSPIIVNDLCRGVRTDPDAKGDQLTAVPRAETLFPLCFDRVTSATSMALEVKSLSDNWEWHDAVIVDLSEIGAFKNIRHYVQKMKRLPTDSHCLGLTGEAEASEFCNAIFSRIESLRSMNAHRQMKERALSDLISILKTNGYSSTRERVPSELMSMNDLFQLPWLEESNAVDRNVLASSESYFNRCMAETHRFQLEIEMIGSDHLTKRQLDTMLNINHQGLLLLCQQRSVLAETLWYRRSLDSKLSTVLSMARDSKPKAYHKSFGSFLRKCRLVVENLRHAWMYLRALEPLACDNLKLHRDCSGRIVNAVDEIETTLQKYKQNTSTWYEVDDVLLLKGKLQSSKETLLDIQQLLFQIPMTPLASCIDLIDESIQVTSEIDSTNRSKKCEVDIVPDEFGSSISLAVKNALLAFQTLVQTNSQEGKNEGKSLWSLHEESTSVLIKIGLKRMDESFERLTRQLEEIDLKKSTACLNVYNDTSMLYLETLGHIDATIASYLSFYRSMGKLSYILVRIFRVLAASGFCSQKEDQDDETDKDASGMNFEEPAEGTGMGDGDGGKDVSDQIENEEQLLGLKDEGDEKQQKTEEKKELDEEEAKDGMEMEGDFEGSLYDVPDHDPEQANDDSGDEVEREMGGEEGDDGNEVVDERLWNDSDDEENDDNQDSNPIEKDSNVKGEGKTEEMMTNDGEEINASESPEDRSNNDAPGDDDADANHDDAIAEEIFEEKHNVDVANQHEESEKNEAIQEEHDAEVGDDLSMGSLGRDDEKQESDIHDDEASSAMEIDTNPEQADPIDTSDDEVEKNADEVIPTPTNEEGVEKEGMDQEGSPTPLNEVPQTTNQPQRGLGIQSTEGNDSLMAASEEEPHDKGDEGHGDTGLGVDEHEKEDSDRPEGNATTSSGGSAINESTGHMEKSGSLDRVPNPFRDPGDVTDFWHKKLNMLERDDDACEGEDYGGEEHDNMPANNNYDFAREDEQHTSQVLGAIEEEEVAVVEDKTEMAEMDVEDNEVDGTNKPTQTNPHHQRKEAPNSSHSNGEMEETLERIVTSDEEDNATQNDFSAADDPLRDVSVSKTQAVSNLHQLNLTEDDEECAPSKLTEYSNEEHVPETLMVESRRQWSEIQGETSQLSRRLCEKLRLVIEPLLASKLRGDYRTGKRINMKRVIGYIASGYQKDKIWLRRTKPAKRNYRVLLAVDDSQSMSKSGAGKMALRALSTLVTGMSQLEIGEIGIASFGNEMNLILPFQEFFTSSNGASVMQHFRFDQARTRTALCLESACQVLENDSSHSMQIMFIVSDGRIERDSRSSIRRLIREMMERNILLVLIIVESGTEDSILNMKEVSFEKGKPVVTNFMDDYPFPYYILLSNMEQLPEVLGDALRQWFELVARAV